MYNKYNKYNNGFIRLNGFIKFFKTVVMQINPDEFSYIHVFCVMYQQ